MPTRAKFVKPKSRTKQDVLQDAVRETGSFIGPADAIRKYLVEHGHRPADFSSSEYSQARRAVRLEGNGGAANKVANLQDLVAVKRFAAKFGGVKVLQQIVGQLVELQS